MSSELSIAVIIPTYNSYYTIDRAVLSVVNQTRRPKRIIIVDDCSNDGKTQQRLKEIVETYNDFIIDIVFLEKNSGPGTARNIGWNMATEKYVAFLDSDDVWHPQKLEIQYNYMEEDEGIKLTMTSSRVITEQDLGIFNSVNFKRADIIAMNMQQPRYLFKHYVTGGTPSLMIKNDGQLRFAEGRRYSEDMCMLWEYVYLYKCVAIGADLVGHFKDLFGAGGLSSDITKIYLGELHNYSILRQKKYYGWGLYFVVVLFSVLKYIRRCILSKIRVFERNKKV